MTGVRNRIERWFQAMAGVIFDWPWLFILIVAALLGGFVVQIPKLRLDTSNESFLHKDDPILSVYEEFKEQFGQDELIIVAVEPPDIFDLAFLEKLKQLHNDLVENVPHLAEITSMVNARNTRGEEDRLIVEDLLEKLPENRVDLKALEERVMSNPLYLHRLISPDGRITSIVLETELSATMGDDEEVLSGFDEDLGNTKTGQEQAVKSDVIANTALDAVERVVENYRADDFRIYIAGSPIVTRTLKASMIRDMRRFLLLATVAIGICLFILFRRLSGVFLPLIAVFLALISTLGLMAWCGIHFNTPHMILPSFLLAVGVGAAVHVLTLVYHHFDLNGDKREAVLYALGHSGLPILLTSLTTAAGLVSFATCEVAPIAYLGVFAGAGVMMGLFYTILLLPALLSIIPLKSRPLEHSRSHHARFDRVLEWVTCFSTGHSKSITFISLALLGVSLFSAAQLHFSHNVLKWLHPDWDARKATEKIDHDMGGTINLEVLIDTRKENGLYDPEILKSLDTLAREIEGIEEDRVKVAKAVSISDILKEIHQALNENRRDFYVVPDNPALIPQEFLLFENAGSDDLEKVTDSRFQLARFTIQLPWQDAFYYVSFIKDIEKRFNAALEDRADITVTGMLSLFNRTLAAAMKSMAKGFLYAGLTITLMMVLMIGSVKIGLISMIPNLTPVILSMGLLYWLNMPLDMFTMLIGAIALGLAVDDTVHFMHNFQRYYAETKDVTESVRKTLHSAGRAMLVTSIILSIGFFLFMFASMQNVVRFGLFTGITVLLALMADFFTVPAMMVLIHPSSEKEGEIGSNNH
ncbi:MAG: MMPL family transporter [Desulfatiglans sp.]|jgi:predicted RND superfamily exporter protein|nr:MMPL family transporter [Desulfatiglans sp.]